MSDLRDGIPGLDGLRAIAVALVIVSHFTPFAAVPDEWKSLVGLAGVTGVNIFFVLSGFLITHLILDEEASTGRLSLKLFYIRRALRILPPLYLYLVVMVAWNRFDDLHLSVRDLLGGAFFFRNWFNAGSVATSHLWSLSIEEQFYLTWPVFLYYVRTLQTRLMLTAFLVIVAPAYRFFSIRYFGNLPGLVSEWRTDFQYDSLLTGCLLALGYRTSLAPVLTAVGKSSALALFAMLFLFVACAGWLPAPYTPFLFVWKSCGYLAIGAIVNWAIQSDTVGGRTILNLPVIVLLGKMSYSIYLWQQVFSRVSYRPWLQPLSDLKARTLPWNLMATLACAAVSFFAVERPLMRVRGRFKPKRG